MKKRKTNTLDSWIDRAEMQDLVKSLAPEDEEITAGNEDQVMEEVSTIGLPAQTVDLNQPEAYQAAPFPSTDTHQEAAQDLAASRLVPENASEDKEGAAPSDDEEGPVLRAARALAEVRLRADESGFLRRRNKKPAVPDAEVTPIPPLMTENVPQNQGQEEDQEVQETVDSASFTIPEGPLRARLDAYTDWAMALASASRIVIVDGQGYPLVHKDLSADASQGDAAMVDSAMRMTSVLEQVQARTDFARDGAMNLPLEEGGWLGVLRCENAGGRLCIAVVTPVPLEIEKSSLMKSELARTMEAGSRE